MSLFNDLQSELIEKPEWTRNYHKIREQINKKPEEKTEKQKRKEMREKLSPKEYKSRYDKQRYKKQREKFKKKYEERRDEFNKEILDEIRWDITDPINREKFYVNKFKEDDTTAKWEYKFHWRASKLNKMDWSIIPRQTSPFRITPRAWLDAAMRELMKKQCLAYEYIKPHLDEVIDCKFWLLKKQYAFDYPAYYTTEPLTTYCNNFQFNQHRLLYVLDWMLRWKFMVSELYLWRVNFIFWDVLVTTTGNLFRIAIENNLPWLTKDTIEDIHKKRMKRYKEKAPYPPIYLVNDAYLIKIPINERENYFYIVPT